MVHIKHLLTISSTSDEMYGHQTEDLARARHLVMPRWPPWRWSRVSDLKYLGMTRWLLKRRRSSTMVRCSQFCEYCLRRCSQACRLASLECSVLYLVENVICFPCFLDLLQLAGSVAGRISMVCLVKAVVSSMRSTSAESRSPTGALDRASGVIWFLPVTCTTLGLYLHEVQSEGLNAWWHLVEFCCAEERDQWLVVCFHSKAEAQHVVTEPFTGPGRC